MSAKRRAGYEESNALAAAIITSDPQRFDGALLEWARAWQARQQAEPPVPRRGQQELFAQQPATAPVETR